MDSSSRSREHRQGWWPGDPGRPVGSGSQNNVRYAVFPGRLAVELNGRVTVYDTLDHNITGVSQQQGSDSALTFSSQYGTVAVTSLPVLHGSEAAAPQTNFAQVPQGSGPVRFPGSESFTPHQGDVRDGAGTGPSIPSATETVALIEQLARLRDAGVLTDDEFNSKKRELLARL
jgi:hypothetical protein